MSQLRDFTLSAPRALPVIVLCDVSGSMSEHGKIDSLNQAMSEMLGVFAAEPSEIAQIQVAVIAFGGDAATLQTPLAAATQVSWVPMKAVGRTPMGGALTIATAMVEDRALVPSRAYRPVIVLVSDGQPNDEWEKPLAALLASDRGSRADRFALAIGEDADQAMLARFVNDPSRPVLRTSDARQVIKFFRWVTMSVTARSRSATPNAAVAAASRFALDEI